MTCKWLACRILAPHYPAVSPSERGGRLMRLLEIVMSLMESDAPNHDPANPGKGDPVGLDLSLSASLWGTRYLVHTARSRAGRGPRWLVQSTRGGKLEGSLGCSGSPKADRA